MAKATVTGKINGDTVKLMNGKLEYCWDGCGLEASKGKHFKPGHDAKLKSTLQAVADGEFALTDLPLVTQFRVNEASNSWIVPAPKFEMATVTIEVTAKVPVGTDVAAIVTEQLMKRKGWSASAQA